MVQTRHIFITTDNKEFDTADAAEAHETSLELRPLAEKFLLDRLPKQKSIGRKRVAELMAEFNVTMLNPEGRAQLAEGSEDGIDDTENA